MAPSSDYILEIRIDVLKTLKIAGVATGVLTAIGLGAYYAHQRIQRTKRVILRDEVKNILLPFQLTDEQLRRVMANMNTEMTNGLKSSSDVETNDLAMFPTYVHHGPSGQESGEYLVVDLGGSNFRVSHVIIEGRNRLRLNNKIFLIPHSLLLGEGEKLFDYISECLQRFIDDNRLALHKPADYKFDLGRRSSCHPYRQHATVNSFSVHLQFSVQSNELKTSKVSVVDERIWLYRCGGQRCCTDAPAGHRSTKGMTYCYSLVRDMPRSTETIGFSHTSGSPGE